MAQTADVTNIKCDILEKTAQEVKAEMYDVQCLIDTDALMLSRVYNWLYNSGCNIGTKKLCVIERYSNRLDLSTDKCIEKQIISCDEVIDCNLITVTDVTDDTCKLPNKTTITILK